MRLVIVLVGLLVLTASSLHAQIASPTINPTLDNLGANPATVPWSYTRIGAAYASIESEAQIAAPPSTTTTGSQTSLNGRAVGDTFAGLVNYVSSSSGGTSNSITELGLAAKFAGWFGVGASIVSSSAPNDLTRLGITAIAGKTWYFGYLNSDNGAGTTNDILAIAYRSEETHVELVDADGDSVLIAETMFGKWFGGIIYNFPVTVGATTVDSYAVSVGVADPKGWSWALNYSYTDADDGAGTFTRNTGIELGVSVGF